jgi:thiosulfate/3-mercaptopyruvate sulfurtransferase
MLRSLAQMALVIMSLAPTSHAAAQGTASALLITPAQLSRALHDPGLVLLQVGPKEDYDAGHIAGARLLAMSDFSVRDSAANLALELPSEADLRARLERLGIGDRSTVVVIPGADWVSPSTRLVWTLQAAGLGARTRFLDGGSEAWKRAGLPTTTAVPPAPTPGHLSVPANRSIVVDYRWVQAHERAAGVRLIDGRAPVFFEGPGMPEHNSPGGHIPGAANIPFNTVFDDSLRVLPIAELQRMFDAAGVHPTDTVAAYCHIGQQATAVLFAARLLGHPIRLYDGSMDDWHQRNLPIENPTAPGKDHPQEPGARP